MYRMKKTKDFKKLTAAIGHDFGNAGLLRQALTHSSYVNEHGLSHTDCNERLEFLGDAVLELAVSRVLYDRYPALPEGDLSRIRSRLVCRASLAALARELELGQYLLLGRGEESTGRGPPKGRPLGAPRGFPPFPFFPGGLFWKRKV